MSFMRNVPKQFKVKLDIGDGAMATVMLQSRKTSKEEIGSVPQYSVYTIEKLPRIVKRGEETLHLNVVYDYLSNPKRIAHIRYDALLVERKCIEMTKQEQVLGQRPTRGFYDIYIDTLRSIESVVGGKNKSEIRFVKEDLELAIGDGIIIDDRQYIIVQILSQFGREFYIARSGG